MHVSSEAWMTDTWQPEKKIQKEADVKVATIAKEDCGKAGNETASWQ